MEFKQAKRKFLPYITRQMTIGYIQHINRCQSINSHKFIRILNIKYREIYIFIVRRNNLRGFRRETISKSSIT